MTEEGRKLRKEASRGNENIIIIVFVFDGPSTNKKNI
jgi:hypothetical protein